MNRKRRLIPDKEKLKTHVRLNEHQVNSSIRWNDMPWKKVSTSNVQGIDDSIFFGLEELDGNYLKKIRLNESSSKTMETESKNDINDNAKDANDIKEPKKKSNRKSLTKLRRENSKVNDPTAMQSQSTDITTDYEQYSNQSLWGDISLNTLLCESLVNLGFRSPTPIQREAIPKTIQADSDIVGVAETGSGKTLAFGLPILNSIIHSYVTSRRKDMYTQPFSRCPQALIIAPTRELAMQISSVLKEICLQMKEKIKIEIVCVVGGMSEQKQRRLLCSTLKPVDIVVGTPGRLCELIQDQEIAAFQDLSRSVCHRMSYFV
jgi:ATP-dependent RNA helicase DDX24/MAK5